MTVGPSGTAVGALIGGKYRIVRLLAKGGMGVVYEAHHAVVRRRFAIKFLRRDLAERRDILTRFQREAEAAGALENENVAAAVDFGISDDGTPYIVMEYLVGESVGALLEREGCLPARRACDLVAQACRGVEAAHAAGIVHRDLKPHNLFLCRRDDGTDLVKVLDFGVAKLQAIEAPIAATHTGTLLGTTSYMSPEQARGDKLVDQRADVYALGAILYELVSRQMPHPGDSQNAILHHIATQPPVPLGSVQQGLAPELVDLVDRALASDPGARPQTAAALATELAPFARREVWPGPPAAESGPHANPLASTMPAGGAGEPASSAGASTADERAPVMAAPPTPAPGRARARPALIAALVLVPIAIAAGIVWRGGASPQPTSGRTSGETSVETSAASSTRPAATSAGAALPAPGEPPPSPAATPPSPVKTEDERAVTAIVPGRPETVGRPIGRPPPVGARRPAARTVAKAPESANGAAPRPPAPASAAPAFDVENPYK